jgi:hypothetical protein
MKTNEQIEMFTLTRTMLSNLLDILPDTKAFDGVDPSWGFAWNELSDDAQALVKEGRKLTLEAMENLGNLLEILKGT